MDVSRPPRHQASAPLQLSDYVRVARRRWKVLVAAIAAGAAIAGLFVWYVGPLYESTAVVLVRPVGVDPSVSTARPDQLVNLPTEEQLIRSSTILQRAGELMGSTIDEAALLDQLTVTIPEGTQVLEITFEASDPERAQRGAQAVADTYLEHRGMTAELAVTDRENILEAEIDSVSKGILSANQKVVSSEEGSLDRALAEADLQLLSSRLRDLQQTLANLSLVSVDPGEVIVPAPLPIGPSSQPPWLVVAIGAVAGLLLGLPLAFVRERLDDRIWDPADVEDAGLSVLGVVPVGLEGDTWSAAHPLAAEEAYRHLSLNIMTTMAASGGNRVAVVPVLARDRAPNLVMDLAAATARMGNHVLLLGFDEGEASLQAALPIESGPGLGDVLLGDRNLSDVVIILDELPQLRVIRKGKPYADRVPWEDFADLVRKLPSSSDVLIAEIGPTLQSADSLRTCRLMDGIVLLAHRGETRGTELRQASEDLRRGGAAVIGVILVGNAPLLLNRPHGSGVIAARSGGESQQEDRR